MQTTSYFKKNLILVAKVKLFIIQQLDRLTDVSRVPENVSLMQLQICSFV